MVNYEKKKNSFGRTLVDALISPYFAPTMIRVGNDNLHYVEEFGEAVGLTIGSVLLTAQILGYADLVQNGYPEVLIFPIVTNICSGIYEFRRSRKNSLDSHIK